MTERASATIAKPQVRQQLMYLYISHPNPAAMTVGWCLFDGASNETRDAGDCDDKPYDSVLSAMRDGWRVIQVPQQRMPVPGTEHRTSYLPNEFILERMIEVNDV